MRKKILLPNNCYCSLPCVHPNDWKTKSANANSMWYLSYRFYDPLIKLENGLIKSKQVILKGGVNEYADLAAKQSAMKALYENELDLLQNRAYNPITGIALPPPETIQNKFEISPDTKLADALWAGYEKLTIANHSKEDMRSVITYFLKSCEMLRYDHLSIANIERRHIRYALDNCAKLTVQTRLKNGEVKVRKKIWTPNQFNHYKAYLRMLFAELLELEAVKYNPVSDIRKQRTVKKIRETLSIEERRMIDIHLRRKKMMSFRIFNRLFFPFGDQGNRIINLKGERCKSEKPNRKSYYKKR
jgi:hypothetical protein